MAIFAIYRYELRSHRQLDKLYHQGEESQQHPAYDSPEALFESFFGVRKQPLTGIVSYRTKGRGKKQTSEPENHGAEVEQHKEHIVQFRLQANKSKKISKEDWTEEVVGHFPDCRVIIDFRPGVRLMVIERNTTAFSDPDKVMKILQDSFSRKLRDYGLTIGMERLSKQQLFWDAVNEIRSKFKDEVKQVTFSFDKQEKVKGDRSFTARLMQWASLFSQSTSLELNVDNDKRLRKVAKDLTRMSELCAQYRTYHLTVRFRDFGLFRFGQDIQAQYGLAEEVIDNFIYVAPQYNLFGEEQAQEASGLSRWFERIIILFEEYGTSEAMGGKRNQEGRV